jgi:hypothetical protein
MPYITFGKWDMVSRDWIFGRYSKILSTFAVFAAAEADFALHLFPGYHCGDGHGHNAVL